MFKTVKSVHIDRMTVSNLGSVLIIGFLQFSARHGYEPTEEENGEWIENFISPDSNIIEFTQEGILVSNLI